MVRGTVLQVGEAALEDQEVLGRLRKRSPHPDLYSDHLLLPGCHCPSQDETQNIRLQHTPNIGISLTDTTPLEDLFNKSNLNIDKEFDGFYEPTLFDF